jgi:hypothetical protein
MVNLEQSSKALSLIEISLKLEDMYNVLRLVHPENASFSMISLLLFFAEITIVLSSLQSLKA